MKRGKGFFPAQLITVLCVLGVFAGSALAQQPGPPTLTVDDCAKCHESEPMMVQAQGAAHKTAINCLDCHQGHRPVVGDNIPECSMCHAGDRHYELEGCLGCHNPHQPLDVNLEGEITGACLTCHSAQGAEMEAKPSMHAEVACNFCHAEKHGMIPECVQCHEPHSDQMTQADCSACHQAHQPTSLEYGAQTASVLCASCHQSAYNQLANTATKHREVACVTCHQERHKMIPQCSDCHGLPHAQTIHEKFKACGDCHSTAHDLNNWSKQASEQKKEEKKK